ncbi:MAG: Cas10/Cmr2 second palm domain-containing protein [Vulcanimicrobiaceae bacterium]
MGVAFLRAGSNCNDPAAKEAFMTNHAVLFELNSIQSWIAESGRLRDLIGGSELIDLMTNESAEGNLLDCVLQSCDAQQAIRFSRRSGGAFYAFCADEALLRHFEALWVLAVQHWAPGLGFSVSRGHGQSELDAFRNARKSVDQAAARPLQIPAAAPIAARHRRTGAVASVLDRHDGPVDAASARKKAFSRPDHAGFITRFSPPGVGWRDWPTNLEAGEQSMPFAGDLRTVALIHADGNGMGQILRNLSAAAQARPDQFIGIFRGFSDALDASIQTAARHAAVTVLLPARVRATDCLAARPIVLGGDDVTVLVRADLALAYALAFARAFESESRRLLQQKLAGFDVAGLPQQLTLGIGLVYMGASQPFSMAADLSEDLMRRAKDLAKQQAGTSAVPASSIKFHRITSSLVDDYDEVLRHELTHRGDDDGDAYRDVLPAYFLDDTQQPNLGDLLSLQHLLGDEDMARGPTRQLLTLVGLAPADARMRYRRWRQLMQDNKRETLQRFDEWVCKLLGCNVDRIKDLPYGPPDREHLRHSPLGDVLALHGAGNDTRCCAIADSDQSATALEAAV